MALPYGVLRIVRMPGHNYLALVRQGGLNPLTLPAHYKAQEFNLHLEEQAFFEVGVKAELPESLKDFSNVSPEILQILWVSQDIVKVYYTNVIH